MEYYEREQLVLKLISGTTFLEVGDLLELKTPTRVQRLRASILYQEAYTESRNNFVLTEEEAYGALIDMGAWSEQKEVLLEKLKEQLDEMKITLFQSIFKSSGQKALKDGIKLAKQNIASLEAEKNFLSNYTCEGAGRQAKEYYLSLCEIYSGSSRWIDPDYAIYNGVDHFDEILDARYDFRYTEGNIRLLARTEPFRAIWNSSDRTAKDLFGASAGDLSQEQQMLLLWATTYDNIYKSPDCPLDEVVNDDDMLDGWLILENRKNSRDKELKQGEVTVSDKIKRAQEVYLMADTAKDAKRVYSLNAGLASSTIKSRMDTIKSKGTVSEMEMPDVQQKLAMEINKASMKR